MNKPEVRNEVVLSLERIAEIKAREEKATPGPWGVDVLCLGTIGSVETLEGEVICQALEMVGPRETRNHRRWLNASFIAAARTDIPALIHSHEALRGENAAVIRRAEAGESDWQTALAEIARLRRALEGAQGFIRMASPVSSCRPPLGEFTRMTERIDAALKGTE